jgi:hypothetical protein
MNRSSRLTAVLLLLAISTAVASPHDWPLSKVDVVSGVAPYVDAVSRLRIAVPTGWLVRAETMNGVRQLRVVPPKADQRERAAIDVVIRVRPFEESDSLEHLTARFKVADEDREAAEVLRYTPKDHRLVVEYREGSYVSGQLWIVRHNLRVFQRINKKLMLEVQCAANASEYKTYRHSLETICLSVTPEE